MNIYGYEVHPMSEPYLKDDIGETKIGSTLYFLFHWKRHWSFITPVKVVSMSLVLTHKETGESVWAFPGDEDINPSPNPNPEEYLVRNAWLWIDEPVGHGLQLGERLYPTLTDAMYAATPWKSAPLREVKRALRKYREYWREFRSRPGWELPDWANQPKPVWVKR